jgi:hypothetical protein
VRRKSRRLPHDRPSERRDDLAQFFGSNPRLLRAFEDQAQRRGSDQRRCRYPGLKDATVIVLSANGDFTNERVLQVGDGIDIEITADTVRLSVKDVARTQDHGVTFVPPGEVVLFLPPDGTLISSTKIAAMGNYATDAAAAAGGVAIGEFYHNAGAMKVRLT